MVNGNLFIVDGQEALLIRGLLHSSAFGIQLSGTGDPGHYDHSGVRTHDFLIEESDALTTGQCPFTNVKIVNLHFTVFLYLFLFYTKTILYLATSVRRP